MAVTIYSKEDQAKGAFDGGRILENKPIGFPQDGGRMKPVSVLFYWAHAWSPEGGLIGEHPHRGFEIESYVLEGEIQHYDSQLKGWKSLYAGDAQIIRAGNGITHAEKLLPGSAIFQIWFDPGLEASISRPASYNDYPKTSFPVTNQDGATHTRVCGPDAPMDMKTPGVSMEEILAPAGWQTRLELNGQAAGIFLLAGTMKADGQVCNEGDFILAGDQPSVSVETDAPCRIFVLRFPPQVEYKLYKELVASAQ